MDKFSVVCIIAWLISASEQSNANTCTTSVEGMTLTRHAYKSIAVEDMQVCFHNCQREELCQSINFFKEGGICEFNNRTLSIYPQHRRVGKGTYYFENPFRAQLGSSQNVPAISCQEIKKSYSDALSGRYWLAPADQGIVTNVYCDLDNGVQVKCNVSRCQNGGTCHYQGSNPTTCSCLPGYTGRLCEIDVDDCAAQPCKNGARCRDGFNSFHCDCLPDFSGSTCEVNTAYECNFYRELNETDRIENFPTPINATPLCDDKLREDWYRITGNAGNAMAIRCVPEKFCNTHGPGWLNGPHPTPQERKVTRRVCFHLNKDCCNFFVDVQVRNCGSFYVYHLKKPPLCYLRFCTTNLT